MNLAVLPAVAALAGGQVAGIALGTFAAKKLKNRVNPSYSSSVPMLQTSPLDFYENNKDIFKILHG